MLHASALPCATCLSPFATVFDGVHQFESAKSSTREGGWLSRLPSLSFTNVRIFHAAADPERHYADVFAAVTTTFVRQLRAGDGVEWDDVIEELPQSGTPAILRHPPPQFILTNLEAENLGMRSLGVPVPCSRSRDTAN